MNSVDFVVIVLLQFAIVFAAEPIVSFFTLSLVGKPGQQLAYMVCLISGNIMISLLFFKIIGIVGVAIGSFATFVVMSFASRKILRSSVVLR